MNAKTLLLLQLTSFVIMLGTAEMLFVNTFPTILFITSLAIFIKCSIYIGKNEKWLIYEKENKIRTS